VLEPNTLLNGRYQILGRVGEGGMATVYRALDTRLGREVAVKVLHSQYTGDEAFLQRFQQEAEFAASLGAHPNIVDIYDIGEDGDLHYIVMEFVEGQSLKDRIAEQRRFSVDEAFAIGQQVASALAFAHARGLIHRDIKPQNILVTPEGIAKVTDFGIARSMSSSQMTRTGMVMGTVHYISPEQAQGKTATPQSDIYSLGVILYEMLAGHLPFDAETAVGIAMQHVHSEPPSLWEYNPELPGQAVAAVMRALEKDPERRYRDAAEFAAALSGSGPTDLGNTTIIADLGQRQTAIFTPVPPPGATTTVTGAPPPRRSRPVGPSHLLRNTALALLALLLLGAIGAGAFFTTEHFLGGAPATSTPTVTPTPHKKRHKKPTATPTVPVVVQQPSPTATLIPATATPTSPPPTPTSKPTPSPVATPTPKPKPTPTPRPTPTPHAPHIGTPTPNPGTPVGLSRAPGPPGHTPPGLAKHANKTGRIHGSKPKPSHPCNHGRAKRGACAGQ